MASPPVTSVSSAASPPSSKVVSVTKYIPTRSGCACVATATVGRDKDLNRERVANTFEPRYGYGTKERCVEPNTENVVTLMQDLMAWQRCDASMRLYTCIEHPNTENSRVARDCNMAS